MKINRAKIMVTGANGFIGRSLVKELIGRGYRVIAFVRHSEDVFLKDPALEYVVQKNLAEFKTLEVLSEVDCLLHLAGRASVPRGSQENIETDFTRTNRDMTQMLAQAAAQMGVRRFIFLSSIGVCGNTSGDKPFTEDTPPAPCNAYTRSKWAAEKALTQVGEETALEPVILRPPLVYGNNPKGNLGMLFRVFRWGLPLPLGAVHNRRSFVALDNLVDLMIYCVDAPQAAGELFLVSDSETLSTTQFLQGLIDATNSRSLLLPIPTKLLSLTAKLLGCHGIAQQLIQNLEIDCHHLTTCLNWRPPLTFEVALEKMLKLE